MKNVMLLVVGLLSIIACSEEQSPRETLVTEYLQEVKSNSDISFDWDQEYEISENVTDITFRVSLGDTDGDGYFDYEETPAKEFNVFIITNAPGMGEIRVKNTFITDVEYTKVLKRKTVL